MNRTIKITLMILLTVLLLVGLVWGYMQLPMFGKLADGKRLERIKQSPNFRDGMFQNVEKTAQFTGEKGRARIMFDFLFERLPNIRPSAALPTQKTDLKAMDVTTDVMVWLGHSSYYLQSGAKRILVDPVLVSASPIPFFNRPFKGTDSYKPTDIPAIDYLIITHDHWDHLDYHTIKALRHSVAKVVCPLGVGAHLAYWGYSDQQIVEMDWNERFILDETTTIHCLTARHFSGRTFKSNQTLWASFMVQTTTQHIYISGDTGYGQHFKQIAEVFPCIDLVLMENGQYNENWRHIHMMPEFLQQAIQDLHPTWAFTGHHGRFALAKHAWDEPLNVASQLSFDSTELVFAQIGEPVLLNDTLPPHRNEWWH